MLRKRSEKLALPASEIIVRKKSEISSKSAAQGPAFRSRAEDGQPEADSADMFRPYPTGCAFGFQRFDRLRILSDIGLQRW